jgi:hypothetical protein
MAEHYYRGQRVNGYVRAVGRRFNDNHNGGSVRMTDSSCRVLGLDVGTTLVFAHPPMRDVELTEELRREIMIRHGYTP